MTRKKESERQVKTYDFKRPDKFSRDQIRTLSMIHETFARLTTTGLSAELQTMCHISVQEVDQLTYEEFIRSLPDPLIISVIAMDGLRGNAVLAIDPALYFTMIDRSFGGPGKPVPGLVREVTEIEMGLLEGIVVKMLGNLRECWSNIIDTKPRLGRVEVNPQFAQVVPPSDMVVLVELKTIINGVEGMMNLCLPYITIEPVIPMLSGKYWYSSIRNLGEGGQFNNVGTLKVDSQVVFDGDDISLKDLGALEKGSLIRIEGLNSGIARLVSGGTPVLDLNVEQSNGNYHFSVISRNKSNDWKPGIESININKNEIKSSLEKSLVDFTETVSGIINNLKEEIQKISDKQDDLVDQISFGSTDNRHDDIQSGYEDKPFSFLEKSETSYVINLIAREHPQTMALILSNISADKASILLRQLPIDQQGDVIQRIATIDSTSPHVVKDIEVILQRKIASTTTEDFLSADGMNTAVNILNIYDRKSERSLLDSLEKTAPDLVESIKQRMFVFDDIVLLDEKAITTIIANCDKEDLVLSLKSVPDEVKSTIFLSLPDTEIQEIENLLTELGPVRLALIEEAQLRIVECIRKLEEKGEIYIARANEEIIE
jgi:flagellar motor switch protein FliM